MLTTDNDLGLIVSKLARKLHEAPGERLQKEELTPSQAMILRYIQSQDQPVSQRQIEQWSEKSHPTVNGLLSRLQLKGFVDIAVDPLDRRQRLITPTDKAITLNDDIHSIFLQHDRTMTSQLSEEELLQLKQLLIKVYESL
ncbi:MAG: MarR family transcriptional regulator [Erysipelotrichaceae bacterium]|nr:MarR family transcriptional regulator [Erysipelotrichaceae bacterium]